MTEIDVRNPVGPKITATMSRDLAGEEDFLKEQAVPSGLDEVRIHAGKMSEEQVAKFVSTCQIIGIPCFVDTNGVKPRTRKSEGMELITEGPETGNWHYQVKEGEEILLVGEKVNIAEIEGVQRQLRVKETTFALRVNLLPPIPFDSKGKRLHFGDANVVCEIIDTIFREKKISAVKLRVTKINNQHGIYWNMGVNSPNLDFYTEVDNLLSAEDLETLSFLFSHDLFPDQIALSFVSDVEQIRRAEEQLKAIGFDPERTKIMAKIETLRGVSNISQIADVVDTVVIARGDLADACRREGRNLELVVTEALRRVKGKLVRVDVATDLANSLFSQWSKEAAEKFGHLSDKEVNDLKDFITTGLVSNLWLCGETMRAGKSAPEIIAMFNDWLRWMYFVCR